MNREVIRDRIFDCITDGVSKFLYYDRKEDPDLPGYSIHNAVSNGIITIDEMVNEFHMGLLENLKELPNG